MYWRAQLLFQIAIGISLLSVLKYNLAKMSLSGLNDSFFFFILKDSKISLIVLGSFITSITVPPFWFLIFLVFF